MTGPTIQAVRELNNISHLPASMNGSPFLYVTSLTSMMCGAVLGLYVVCWMLKELFRDRNKSRFRSVLFNFRLMMTLAGLSAFMACTPEVLYLQMFGDPTVSDAVQSAVIQGKRIMDSSRIYVIIGWVTCLVMIYPYVCLALMDNVEKGEVKYLQVEDYPGLGRLWKPAIVFISLAVIAVAFAFSKV